jgi:ABC-type multidrug transport system fused ATPase/permease subunit
MEYGEVLSRSWKTIWKHKVLWIFGILAGCVGGNSGGSSGGSGNTGYQFNGGDLPPEMQRFAAGLNDTLSNTPWWVFMLIGLGLLALIALVIFLGITGRIALIHGTRRSEEGAERLTFSELFSASMPYFWRVFGLNLLVGLGLALLMIIALVPVIFTIIGTLGIALLCLFPIVCLLVLLAWAVGIVLQLANVALINDDLGVTSAIERGWRTAREHLGPVVVMALILGIGGWVASLLISLPVILVVLPAGLSVVLGELAGSRNILVTGLATAGICLAVYLPVLIVAQGILMAYIQAAWTLTYRRLRAPAAAAPGPEVAPTPAG